MSNIDSILSLPAQNLPKTFIWGNLIFHFSCFIKKKLAGTNSLYGTQTQSLYTWCFVLINKVSCMQMLQIKEMVLTCIHQLEEERESRLPHPLLMNIFTVALF